MKKSDHFPCLIISLTTYVIGDWKKCGLLENNSEVALDEYRRQMHHDIVMPEDPVQEESVIELGVGKFSTPEHPKNVEREKGVLEILESYHFLK